MDFRAPDAVIQRLREGVDHGIYGYTRRDERHYEIVRQWFSERHGWSPALDSLLPAPAIMPTVAAIIRTFTKVGDGIIVQAPVYSPYYEVIRGNDRTLLINQLRLVDDHYELDLEGFEALAASGARAFLMCNPHNPAGKAWTIEELSALNAVCETYGLIVISDEIHCDIRLSERPHIPFPMAGDGAADRSFVCLSPTKTFNLAGIPSAVISVANNEMRQRLFSAMSASFMLNASYFGRLGLETAYSEGGPWLDELTGYLKSNVDFLEAFARDHMPEIRPMRPDASFLVWLDVRALERRVGNVQQFFARNAKVNVYDGLTYGPGGEGFVRMNLGCARAVLREALERMAAAVLEVR